MVTVFDVAEHAQLSIATVSRAISGKSSVALETRERVLASAAALGYKPNAFAKSLRTGRGTTVAYVTGDMRHGASSALAGTVQLELEKLGLDTMLYDMQHSQARLEHLLESVITAGLHGVILATSDTLDMQVLQPYIEKAKEQGIVFLSVTQQLTEFGISSVVHDNAGGVKRAMEHLLQRGRKRIAFLGRIATSATGRERFSGYVGGLAAIGHHVNQDLVWEPLEGYRSDAGYETVHAALKRAVGFDAIMAATDELALGALAALREYGLHAPDDVAVMGFGAAEWGRHVFPSISTTSLDSEAIASVVHRFFSSDQAGPVEASLTLIPTELVVLETT